MTFFENDLFVIVKLAFPDSKRIIVLDPGKTVVKNYDSGFFYAYTRDQVLNVSKEKKEFILVNLSGAASFSFPFDFSVVEGIISFNTTSETSLDYFHFELFYVVDQQKRVRWLISENHKHTDFLNDYYQPQFITDISNLFSGFGSFFNYLKVKLGSLNKVTDGNCQILKRDKNFFSSINNDQYASYTVNFKDHTAPGIIRIRLYQNNKFTWVINHAINPAGIEKIATEKMVLTEITKKNYLYFGIPDFLSSEHSVVYRISPTFKSGDSIKTRKLIGRFLTDAVLEFQNLYKREISLNKFWRSTEVLRDINWIKSKIGSNQLPRGISAINVTKLYANLLHLFKELDLNKTVCLSLNNNHLYSENIYSADNKLYITSWANADFDLPLLFDLFQTELYAANEVNSSDAEDLYNNLIAVLKSQSLTEFSVQNNIDIDFQFKVFIIVTFIEELKQLLANKIVMPESNIKLHLWLDLTNRFAGISE